MVNLFIFEDNMDAKLHFLQFFFICLFNAWKQALT